MTQSDHIVTRSVLCPWRTTRRAGVREKGLLNAEQSPYQNLVLVQMDRGAEVEPHGIRNSESIFVMEGRFEFSTPQATESLGPGDLCHFPPGTNHGLRCLEGPGRFLAIFAPAASGPDARRFEPR